jgi:hypothetical protein
VRRPNGWYSKSLVFGVADETFSPSIVRTTWPLKSRSTKLWRKASPGL